MIFCVLSDNKSYEKTIMTKADPVVSHSFLAMPTQIAFCPTARLSMNKIYVTVS